MRKIIFQNMVTLDGFFAGPNGEIDWHLVGKEFNEYAIDFLDSLDALLFGRVTYEGMASYWASEQAMLEDPIVAHAMNIMPKIVFSRRLEKVEWSNSRLIKDNLPEEITKLKGQPGKDMAIFGSADLAVTLLQNNLIDEFRVFINPILLGEGKPLFKGLQGRRHVKLVDSKVFPSGLVLLIYQPA
jgi:dihydrofolate reductase